MVDLRKQNNQKMTIYKPAKLPRSLKQLPPIRRALRMAFSLMIGCYSENDRTGAVRKPSTQFNAPPPAIT